MKKNKPTISQYSYMVTGLLSAWIREHKDFPDLYADVVEDAVNMTKFAFDRIAELCEEPEDNEQDSEVLVINTPAPGDPFNTYPWDGQPARYTDLQNWVADNGIKSKRKFAGMMNRAIEMGYLFKDPETKKYHHYQHSPLRP